MTPPPFQKPIEISQLPAGDWIEQPKLDGVAAAYSSGKLWSKSGKIFPSASFAHIINDLRSAHNDSDDYAIYGELWSPDYTLQEINGMCNHHRISTEPVPLLFVIYDYFDRRQPFAGYTSRLNECADFRSAQFVYFIGCPPPYSNSSVDGTIYRAPRGIFISDRPTPNVRKLKNRAEMDATVVGCELGAKDSKIAGLVSSLHCLTPGGVPFSVYSGLTFEQSTWYRDSLPKKVKVKYLRLSDAGAPLNPVFLEEVEI